MIRDFYNLSIINVAMNVIKVKKAEKMNANQLAYERNKHLRSMLKYVFDHSLFYRSIYKSAGIDTDAINQIQLAQLPIINKSILMNHFDDILCDKRLCKEDIEKFICDPENLYKKYNGKYEVVHTSGSTGEIGIFIYGPRDWAIIQAIVFSRVSKNRISLANKSTYAFMGAIDGHYAGISLVQSAPGYLFDKKVFGVNQPLCEIVTELNQFNPELLCGYSSCIYQLALEQKAGNLTIQPKRIICSGDILTKNMEIIIADAFGVNPFNFYAASESLAMGVDCDLHKGIHFFDDIHVFEVIKEDGSPAENGEIGNLVVTTLYNRTLPLIRYKMNDMVRKTKEDCECGWPFLLFEPVVTRVEEFLCFRDHDGNTKSIHPIILSEFIVPGLKKIQFIQLQENKLKINAVTDKEENEVRLKIKIRMDEILLNHGLTGTVDYEIYFLNDILPDPVTGKHRLIIPYKK